MNHEEQILETGFEEIIDVAPAAGRVPLNGWLERNRYNPVLLAIIFVVLSFVVYAIVSAVALIMTVGLDAIADPERLVDHVTELLTTNAIGQYIGLALLAILFAWWSSSSPFQFLRLRSPDWVLVGYSIVGLAILLPIVQWLGQINELIPLPEFLTEMEGDQIKLLEDALLNGKVGLFMSLFTLAITPAICEELAFRGYLQRQFERRIGGMGAVILVGIIFGLFHLRLSQAIPLSTLGIYMGYVSWKSGSLWTAIIVHFANNGFLTLAANYYRNSETLDPKDLDEMKIPLYVVGIALVLFVGLIKVFGNRVNYLLTKGREL